MGILNFNKWLKETYPKSFLPQYNKRIFDYIYIDVNHVLHHALNSSRTEAQFVKNLFYRLDMIFNNYIAKKKIVLGVDGTAPYSKVITQRKRRLQSVNKIKINNLNSLHLTPGTKFMSKLSDCIYRYVNKLKKNYKFINVDVDISLSDEPDEGELKIFRKLIEYGKNNYYSHLVIGNDADLVVMALAANPIKNIYLLINYSGEQKLISINKLMNIHSKKYINKGLDNIRDDFAMISLLMGNDYLPKLMYIKFSTIWKAYQLTKIKNMNNLIVNGNFNIKFLQELMLHIISLIPHQFKSFSLEKYNDKDIKNYLEGLLWCFNMYQTGYCPMYDYLYIANNSPHPIHILYYTVFNNNLSIEIPKSDTKPLSNDIYTLLLMPKKARKMIPEKYQKFIDNELKYMYTLEDCDECQNHKNDLSKFHKELRSIRLDNLNEKITDNDSDPTINVRKQIGKVSSSLHKHKKNHIHDFTINDIARVVEFTKNI
jgi:5'-3' exonuclease